MSECKDCELFRTEMEAQEEQFQEQRKLDQEEYNREIDKLQEELEDLKSEYKNIVDELHDTQNNLVMMEDALIDAAETVLLRAGMSRKQIDDIINRHRSIKNDYKKLAATLFGDALAAADEYESANMIYKEII